MYQLIASNLEQGRKKRDTKSLIQSRKLSEGDSVLLKDHTMGVWDPKCTRDYRIVPFPGRTQVEVVDSSGTVKVVHISYVKYGLPADCVISKLSDYQPFGRQSKLRIDPKNIPNLKWEPTVIINTNFMTASSKLDSISLVTKCLNPSPMVSTTSLYILRPQTQ